jgi:hypothetical protein
MKNNEKRKILIMGVTLFIVIGASIFGLNMLSQNLQVANQVTDNLGSTLPDETLPVDDGEMDVKW